MKNNMLMVGLLSLVTAFSLAAKTAHASEYNCQSKGFTAYLVFDDGPGGLDHAVVGYAGKQYTLAENLSDDKTPEGKFEYGGNELALELTAKGGPTFILDASRASAGKAHLQGSLSLNGKRQGLNCREIGATEIVFAKSVKNRTCGEAAGELAILAANRQDIELGETITVVELAKGRSYRVLSKLLSLDVTVFDMRDEDGTCTSTHVKLPSGEVLDLQREAISIPYPN